MMATVRAVERRPVDGERVAAPPELMIGGSPSTDGVDDRAETEGGDDDDGTEGTDPSDGGGRSVVTAAAASESSARGRGAGADAGGCACTGAGGVGAAGAVEAAGAVPFMRESRSMSPLSSPVARPDIHDSSPRTLESITES